MENESCGNCGYSRQQNGGLVCARFPPHFMVLMPKTSLAVVPGQQVETQAIYGRPPVHPDGGWCGEWKKAKE